ncbi:AraC family transcriptional regulator [Enterococcus sp. LJL120]
MRYSFNQKDRSLPLFVDSFGTNWQQEQIQRPKGYPYVHWLFSEKGSGTVLIDNQKINLPVGTSILINQTIPHDYYPNDAWETAYFTFGGALISEIMTLLGFGNYLVISENAIDVENFVNQLTAEIEKDTLTTPLKVSGMIYSFLMLIKESTLAESSHYSKYHDLIQPVVTYIKKHYAEEIRNEELAQLIGYSPQYLNRLFKDVYQTSPNQYLLEYRMQKAKELLANEPLLTIQEISAATGFSNASHFIALFKRSEQVTPKNFRRYYIPR